MFLKVFDQEVFKNYTEKEVNDICKYKTYEDFLVREFIKKYSLQVDEFNYPKKDYVKFNLEDYYSDNPLFGSSFGEGFIWINEDDEILDNNKYDKNNNDIFYFESSEENHENIKKIFTSIQTETLCHGIPNILLEDRKISGEYYIYMYTYFRNDNTAIRIMYTPKISLTVDIMQCTKVISYREGTQWRLGDCIVTGLIKLNITDTRKLEKYVCNNELDITKKYRNELMCELEDRELERAESIIYDFTIESEEFNPEDEGLSDLYEYYYK